MDGFQLYWAVAIPSTAVVFVVWSLVTQRSWILNKALRHRRAGKKGLLVSSKPDVRVMGEVKAEAGPASQN